MKIEYPFPVCKHTIGSLSHIRSIISLLLARSAWFVVMPLPDDQWEVTIKEENESFILTAMANLHTRRAIRPFTFTEEDVWKVLYDAGFNCTASSETVRQNYRALATDHALTERIVDAATNAETIEDATVLMQGEIKAILAEKGVLE